MLKKTLVSVVVSLGLVSSLSADSLKGKMDMMANSMSSIQYAYLANNREMAIQALAGLKKTVDSALSSEDYIRKMLPKALKQRSSIAINSARLISENISKIEAIAVDKKTSAIKREMKAQEAFANIQEQCFRCHNLVRDWK